MFLLRGCLMRIFRYAALAVVGRLIARIGQRRAERGRRYE